MTASASLETSSQPKEGQKTAQIMSVKKKQQNSSAIVQSVVAPLQNKKLKRDKGVVNATQKNISHVNINNNSLVESEAKPECFNFTFN